MEKLKCAQAATVNIERFGAILFVNLLCGFSCSSGLGPALFKSVHVSRVWCYPLSLVCRQFLPREKQTNLIMVPEWRKAVNISAVLVRRLIKGLHTTNPAKQLETPILQGTVCSFCVLLCGGC